jgi:hypothetical protein
VRERQIQELLLLGRQSPIEAPADGSLRDLESLAVGGVDPWRAAKHVARHLIEWDAQRETALRALLPRAQLADRRAHGQSGEALAELLIECRCRRKPMPPGLFGESEGQYLRDAVHDPPYRAASMVSTS